MTPAALANAAGMEERLQHLVCTIRSEDRFKWAKGWKRQAKRVVGIESFYVPEEIVHAAGILPWHLVGTTEGGVDRARTYFPERTDQYCTRILESFLTNELDFLDGVVASDLTDEARRLGDNLIHIGMPSLVLQLHIPYFASGASCAQFVQSLYRLKAELERLSGVEITESALRSAINLFNRMRLLLSEIYEMRKRPIPPLTGEEALGIVNASLVMPKDEYVRELDALFPYLAQRTVTGNQIKPRLLVSSDKLLDPRYVGLVEKHGALVAMDDIDSGSRYFIGLTPTEGDPIVNLARRYLERPPETRMGCWDKHILRIREWVRDYHIQGVINMVQTFDFNRLAASPFMFRELDKAGIPATQIIRECVYSPASQLSTRIQAFIERL